MRLERIVPTRTCELKHRLHMARVKLVALRALAEQNKLAEESIGGLDECDTASLEAVSFAIAKAS